MVAASPWTGTEATVVTELCGVAPPPHFHLARNGAMKNAWWSPLAQGQVSRYLAAQLVISLGAAVQWPWSSRKGQKRCSELAAGPDALPRRLVICLHPKLAAWSPFCCEALEYHQRIAINLVHWASSLISYKQCTALFDVHVVQVKFRTSEENATVS